MIIPIRLQTKYGLEQFIILNNQKKHYINLGFLQDFQDRCKIDYKKMSDYMQMFLDADDIPDEKEDLSKFNEMSDICSSLLYFTGLDNKKKELCL
jgi:hypothetical protein